MKTKICKDCVYCSGDDGYETCLSPKLKQIKNLINGEMKTKWKYCSTQREDPWPIPYIFGTCGTWARWFVAKESYLKKTPLP